MRDIPEINYEHDIQRLVSLYKRGIFDIMAELNRLDLTDMQRAQILATLKNVAEILRSINEESSKWVEEVMPKAVTDGIAGVIYSLGVVETAEEVYTLIKLNKANKALTEAVIADTQADLLRVTTNINDRTKYVIRQATQLSFRANYAKGINGRRAISVDILREMRETLGKAVDTGIIDARNIRWKPLDYVDMLVRTKTMTAHIDATINEAVAREAYYGRISKHGATDACRNYEGKIVKLVPDAPGDYPYIGDLRGGRDIFHPNCKHTITPTRLPNGI
ncbi:phage minor capsid protein [Aneurinibacillus migulanus]|uniref:phage minor capsid protein n=1 Tax=Aneurinibacillus migulanus TaxID=47500 RepID=UPI0020A011B5|nr:phage minor capsid protein [Aneurinibacillus migulanus]MCP1354656.1 phage minor capsid protein [Aneurinibacillus migulanus]